jgi:hypothetical protein
VAAIVACVAAIVALLLATVLLGRWLWAMV